MNEYKIYPDTLSTNEVFVIEIANNPTKPVQLVIKYVNNINDVINKKQSFNKNEPNTCYIIIDYNDYRKTKEIITKAWYDLNKIPVEKDIKIIYNNQIEQQIAEYIKNSGGLNVIIEGPKTNTKKEEDIKETFNKYISTRNITKEDNGILRTYIERKADDNNLGYMLEGVTAEDMYNYYNELLKDDNNQRLFSDMDEQEIANHVLDSIAETGNYKKYYLESSREQAPNNMVGAVSGAFAENNDGKVNKEIGVVINDPSKKEEINTVEEDNEEVRIMTPTVNKETSSNSYGFNHSSTNDYYGDNNNDYNLMEEKQQEREETRTFVKKRVKIEPHYNAIDQNRGIVSLPTIIFILSGILLIASIILFIVSK